MGEIDIDDGCCSTQLIDGNGDLNVEGLDSFVKKTKFSDCGLSYAVVAIMGPQSSGKSTLLNHIFKTHFREMDAFEGRSQTTKGIWIAKCDGMEPFTVAMDLEGTDGRERGEDDTTFEKQTALFALTVANYVLINMWCHDIGREQASNKPLLKTVFQVMMRLFSPRKTTLLFVIRDKTKTPMEKLEPLLRQDIQKIWDSVLKPETHKDSLFSEFFNVDIVVLSSYENKEELFKQEVAELRQRIYDSTSPGGLAGDRRGAVPASGFSFSTQEIWKTIKENRDLDLPTHKVMVATVRCEEIANEKLRNLATDESWAELQKAVEDGPVSGFGKKLRSILEKYFSEYDAEALYFDEGVRKEKFLHLKHKALDFVYPAYATMVRHVRSSALEFYKIHLEQSLLNEGEGFAKAVRDSQQSCLILFDKGCEAATPEQWTLDASKFRHKFVREMEAHTSFVRTAKLAELTANYERQLIQGLSGPVESLLEEGGRETWPEIRKLIKGNTETAVSGFLNDVSGFELDHATTDGMVQNLKDYNFQSLVEQKAREEAARIAIRMKDRFSMVFNHDKDSMSRVWTEKEDIRAITKDAHSEVLGLLAVMAAIRLDERPDTIESILSSSLLGKPVIMPHTSSSWEELNTLIKWAWEEVNSLAVMPALHLDEGTVSGDPLASTSWEEVPPKDLLLTPVQCKSLWRQFVSETEYMVTEAISAQEALKRKRKWLWVFSAIVVTGVIGSCCFSSC